MSSTCSHEDARATARAGGFQRAPGSPALPTTTLPFLWHYVCLTPGRYAAAVVLTTLGTGSGMLLPWALGRVVRGVAAGHGAPAATIAALRAPLTTFVVLCASEVLFGRLADAIQVRTRFWLRQAVTREMFHYLQCHSHRFLSENFAGALAHRISEASQGVAQTLFSIIMEFWPTAVTLTSSLVLLSQAHAGLGRWFFLWSVAFIGVSAWLSTISQKYSTLSSAARSATTGFVVDSVSNLGSTRLFSRGDHERSLLEEHFDRENVHVTRSTHFNERVRWFQFTASAVLKGGTLCVALRLWGRGEIDVAVFVMATSITFLIINEARNLSRRFLEFSEHVGAVQNGIRTLVHPHEVIDAPDARQLEAPRGAIEFRGVTFSYGLAAPIFDRLDVTIPAGQKVGLVGRSGSGKSTFVNLVLRLFELQGGSIRIDGQDIRHLRQDSLRQTIGLIPQDPSLFHRSLRDNIRYGRLDASDEAVEIAARKAYAHEFIRRIDEGYEALVGERGIKLSGGQRQRIAIARVILKNAPILILDEATSALDSITERAIQETLTTEMRGKTVLVIAHRLSTVAGLDRIIVFDEGRIIDDGRHAELLLRGGAYAELWRRQSEGFLDLDSETDEGGLRRTTEPQPPAPPEALDADPEDLGEIEHAIA